MGELFDTEPLFPGDNEIQTLYLIQKLPFSLLTPAPWQNYCGPKIGLFQGPEVPDHRVPEDEGQADWARAALPQHHAQIRDRIHDRHSQNGPKRPLDLKTSAPASLFQRAQQRVPRKEADSGSPSGG